MNRRAPRVGASLRQLLHWGLANTLKQKFDLENAMVRNKLGGDAGTLPFGSTVVNVREVVPGNTLSRLAPLLLAGVTGGLAAAGLASWWPRPVPLPPVLPPAQTPAPTLETPRDSARSARKPADRRQAPPAAPRFLDGILEWELQANEHLPTR